MDSAIPDFFSKMLKEQNMKNISKDEHQLHGEALLVQWVSQSLRLFKIVENNEFLSYSSFLCRLRGQFKVPSRNKTRNQMMQLSEFAMKGVTKDLRKDMDFYSLTTDTWFNTFKIRTSCTLQYVPRSTRYYNDSTW